MDNPSFFNSELFRLGLIPLLIFLARVADVSIGTIRIMFISRGMRTISSLLGFFEILIWLVAISQIMKNLTNVTNYIAYAAGFGMGNFVGMSIERKLSLGNLMIRAVTKNNGTELVKFLRSKGYGATGVSAEGTTGPVKVIFTVVRRKDVEKVIEIIKKFNPNAFYTIEDIRLVAEHKVFPIYTPYRNLFQRFTDIFQKRK
jgi:uncharacterized protein YebE (UPF0316 family)